MRGKLETHMMAVDYEQLIKLMDEYIAFLKRLAIEDPIMAKEEAMKALIATGMVTEDGVFQGIEELNND